MEILNNNSIKEFNFEIEIDGLIKIIRFKMYNEDDFPKIEGQCVYIFTYYDKIEKDYHHRHVSNTADFNGTFPDKDAKKHLSHYKSNQILIYKCEEGENELKIEQALRCFIE